MTSAQRDSIHFPAKDLLIFNTTTNRLEANVGLPESPQWNAVGHDIGLSVTSQDTARWNGLATRIDQLLQSVDSLKNQVEQLELQKLQRFTWLHLTHNQHSWVSIIDHTSHSTNH